MSNAFENAICRMPSGRKEVNADASSRAALRVSLFIGALHFWLLRFGADDEHSHERREAIYILLREVGG
jgi:hypothetical protein